MLFGLSHLCLPVNDLAVARRFYADAVGLELLAERPGSLDLDASGSTLRLVESVAPLAAVTLHLQTAEVGAAADLLQAAGATLLRAAAPNSDDELAAELADPFGHRLVLWRRLREDELDRVPELPITRPWQPAAEVLLQALLARVPPTFRDLARTGSVAEAEHLCPLPGEVETLHAVRAYIRATPRFRRDYLKPALIDHGFDPQAFAADFVC